MPPARPSPACGLNFFRLPPATGYVLLTGYAPLCEKPLPVYSYAEGFMGSPRNRIQQVGLLAGPVLFVLAWVFLSAQDSPGLPPSGRATLACLVWMAVWWLTEAVEIYVTALLPIALFPLLGIASIKSACAPYASDLIFLFMGGFIFALSMQRWGLDRRIALLTLRLVGARPPMMLLGCMAATATMSAFVSNTATASMMLPIGLSIVRQVHKTTEGSQPDTATDFTGISRDGHNFGTGMMLGIAYASSIGGLATLVGSPPNVILAGFLRDGLPAEYQLDMGFTSFMELGLPLTVILLPITWALLAFVLFPVRLKQIPGGPDLVKRQLTELGPMKPGEAATMTLFFFTAGLWISRPWLTGLSWGEGAEVIRPFAGLNDAGIVMLTALLLFIVPINRRFTEFVTDWKTASALPWGILVLFGGGLSLAEAVQKNGVAEFLGGFAAALSGVPDIVVILLVTSMVVFLTELTSNTATTATLLPVFAGMAPIIGLHPAYLLVPVALGASCAFMLPVATPPNAIVFGSGLVSPGTMIRAGFWLNLLCILLLTMLAKLVVPLVFDLPD